MRGCGPEERDRNQELRVTKTGWAVKPGRTVRSKAREANCTEIPELSAQNL